MLPPAFGFWLRMSPVSNKPFYVYILCPMRTALPHIQWVLDKIVAEADSPFAWHIPLRIRSIRDPGALLNPLSLPVRCHSRVISVSAVLSHLLALCGYFAAGCSSASSSVTMPPPPPSPTSVTVVVSSTANAQLTSFYVDVTSITLTNQAGSVVTVLAAPQSQTFTQTYEAEFIHLNGQAAPFLTAMVPQDTYTSATLTFSYAQFTHVGLNASGGLDLASDATGGPTSTLQTASVNLPAPLAIQGSAMAVSLDLQVSSSATFTGQGAGQQDTFTLTPIFTLTPVAVTSQSQIQIVGVDGLVSSITSGSNSLSLMIDYGYNNPTYPDGSTFTVATNAGTVYQGVANFSALAAGMIANLDLALQSDGSLLATRIEVDDPSATNVLTGLVGTLFAAPAEIRQLGRTNEEFNQTDVPGSNGMPYSLDVSSAFKLSGQIALPSNLPFSATFDGSTLFAGQNVAVASQVLVLSGATHTHATTVTLMPQIINGTITGVSNTGAFTIYSVSLASYDLFPTLAVQPGQTTALNNPSSVQVYVDSNTRMLNSNSIALGNVLRFNGLIFNDSGTARMVCSQVNDGVAP